MDDQGRDQILFEQLLSEMQAIRQYVAQIPEVTATLAVHGDQLEGLQGRLMSIELIVAYHSADLKEIKGLLGDQMERTAALEATAHTH